MGVKNKSEIGYRLYIQEAVFKAILTEYPRRYVRSLVRLGPEYAKWNGVVIDEVARSIEPQLKSLTLEPFVTIERLGRLLNKAKGYGDITTKTLKQALQTFPDEGVLLHPSRLAIEGGLGALIVMGPSSEVRGGQVAYVNEDGSLTVMATSPAVTYRAPSPPRAFDPANETQGEYIKYIKDYCKQASEGYVQHTQRKQLERDALWVAWHLVEGLRANEIADRWLERTGEEGKEEALEDTTIYLAIRRTLNASGTHLQGFDKPL